MGEDRKDFIEAKSFSFFNFFKKDTQRKLEKLEQALVSKRQKQMSERGCFVITVGDSDFLKKILKRKFCSEEKMNREN